MGLQYMPSGTSGMTAPGFNSTPDDWQLKQAQVQALGKQGAYQYGSGFGPSQAAQDQQTLAAIPVNAQMQRFNTILPYLTGSLSSLNSNFASAGGTNAPAPQISVGGVLNDQQVQQQVNTSRAANDAATQNSIRNAGNSIAGRGFGANSPLAMAMQQGYQNQNLQSNTANETATRLNAAQANAGQLLNSQQARSSQWQQENALDIQRRLPYFQHQNALIAALAGLA